MSSYSSLEMGARATLARWGVALAFLILAGAFFRAQVLESDQFRLQSESGRLRAMLMPPPRGDILDRHGELIAESTPGYSVRLLAARTDSLRAVLLRLDALIPEDTLDIDAIVAEWRTAPFRPVLIYGSGDFLIVSRLQERRAAIPGLVIQAEPRRHYPDGAAVGHIAGYAGGISARELEGGAFREARMGDIVGKAGLEVAYDSVLRGRAGVRYAEVTPAGRMIRGELAGRTVAPTPGASIQTTIDLPLQRFIDSMWTSDSFLRRRNGAVIAMRPDGGVLALYSFPSFDPNAFVGGISTADWQALNTDPRIPLFDRAVGGTYPPASPFKLAIAAMGLKRGLVTMTTRMAEPCTGGYQFGSRRFKCWKPEGHGRVDLTGAIKTSCDVYFYQLGLMLGPDTLLADAQRLGLGEPSGIDIPGEARPGIGRRIKDYVDASGRSVWYGGETLNLSIGQGRNTQTLTGMVAFYAALANGGLNQAPFLVSRRRGAPRTDLALTPEQLAGLRNAMAEVVAVGGTAGRSGGGELLVAGKTGTGQMPSGQADAGWFIGFAPHDNPEIVIGMVVEAGEHGSTVAPYVVRMIRRYLLGPDAAVISAPVDLPVTEALVPPPDSLATDSLPEPAGSDSAIDGGAR
jgi:penicillin-binding protein 2